MNPALRYLEGLPRYVTAGQIAIKPGFDRIRRLLDGMNRPQESFRSVLVAGTNGKGSVSSILAACLSASGERTGLHTSPHLIHVTERMRVDGRAATQEWVGNAIAKHTGLFEEVQPSYYEAVLALSLFHFAEKGVDRAIVEVGLGGRLDASNILDAEASVITSISLDHTEILGSSIEEIAREKAGIFKEGRSAIVGRLTSSASAVVEQIAIERNALFERASDFLSVTRESRATVRVTAGSGTLNSVEMDLQGTHQLENAETALRTFERIGAPWSDAAIRSGLESTARLSGIRGRSEIICTNPLVMIDVAHNPDSIDAALDTFDGARDRSRPGSCLIMGLVSDKDAPAIGALIARREIRVITVPTEGERGLPAKKLAKMLKMSGVGTIEIASSVQNALDSTRRADNECLIAGSYLVVAEAIQTVEG